MPGRHGPVRGGLISDTHGLVRPEALAALAGADRILHAGDIGGPAVLEALAAIAPVTAIRGNNDADRWGRTLPETEFVEIEGRWIYLVHDLGDLDIDPAAAGVDVVMSGHSHKPALFEDEGVLYVNPGSAGPRRFSLPISVGSLLLAGDGVRAQLTTLEIR